MRGLDKLAANDPESALLLAEAALAADNKNHNAVRLSLAAHEALLARSGDGNFWETGWLTHQIASLKNALATTG